MCVRLKTEPVGMRYIYFDFIFVCVCKCVPVIVLKFLKWFIVTKLEVIFLFRILLFASPRHGDVKFQSNFSSLILLYFSQFPLMVIF